MLSSQAPLWLWPKGQRLVKPLPPPEQLAAQVKQQVLQWAAVRVRTDADLEKLLIADAREEEKRWHNYAEEEAEIAVEVAEYIWEDLVADTADVLMELEGIIAS